MDLEQDAASRHQALVNRLKERGYIRTPAVEAAWRAVPRHLFVPHVPLDRVYRDEVIVTKEANGEPRSSCEQPAIVAIMLEQLALDPGQRVLEIGSGTGHTAALLAYIVGGSGQVTTLDIDPELVVSAREHLADARLDRVQVVCADGWAGYPMAAPYDRILLTAAAWDLSPAWIEQLKPNGRLVLPLAIEDSLQMSVAFAHRGDHLESLSTAPCGFMRLRGDLAARPELTTGQLGPEPGLSYSHEGPRKNDPDRVYTWLLGTRREFLPHVRVSVPEIWQGLNLWLFVHAPEYFGLSAEGEMVKRDRVPPVFRFSGIEGTWCATIGLLEENGLALVALEHAQSGETELCEDAPAGSSVQTPAELSVWSYGPEETAARHLIALIAEWDRAGRPGREGLRIRVYPQKVPYAPAPGEAVVDKRHNRLVFDWQAKT